jgi:hypothetical protein
MIIAVRTSNPFDNNSCSCIVKFLTLNGSNMGGNKKSLFMLQPTIELSGIF